jgi:hypothetical protein
MDSEFNQEFQELITDYKGSISPELDAYLQSYFVTNLGARQARSISELNEILQTHMRNRPPTMLGMLRTDQMYYDDITQDYDLAARRAGLLARLHFMVRDNIMFAISEMTEGGESIVTFGDLIPRPMSVIAPTAAPPIPLRRTDGPNDQIDEGEDNVELSANPPDEAFEWLPRDDDDTGDDGRMTENRSPRLLPHESSDSELDFEDNFASQGSDDGIVDSDAVDSNISLDSDIEFNEVDDSGNMSSDSDVTLPPDSSDDDDGQGVY